MESFDVVIVGGAVTGSAAAYFLGAQPAFGGSVLILEKDFSYARCATTLSAASIRQQFSTPENIRISQYGTAFLRSIAEHLTVEGETPAIGFHEGGYLFLAGADGVDVLQSNHRVQHSLGVDVALLAPAALGERFPGLATDDLRGGSLGLSGEGWFDAEGLMRAFRRKALALGATVHEAHVTGFERAGNRVTALRLADGTRIGCGTVINAAGTGAAALARSAGIALPVEARKRCVFHFTSPAKVAGCPLVIDPGGLWFRPEGSGFLCGVAPSRDPPCEDFEVDHTLFDERLWPALARRVPGFEALRLHAAWAGHYDVNTLDHNVILGAHPEVLNLFFANGFSGHGLQQSPAIGRALSELVVHGGYRTLDLSAFGWQRVIDGRPLREINVV